MFKKDDVVIEIETKIKMKVIKRIKDVYLNTSLNVDPDGEYVEVLLIHPKTNKPYVDVYHYEELILDPSLSQIY